MGMPSYRVRKAVAGSVPCSATRIQRPTVLSWAFSFVLPAEHSAIWPLDACGQVPLVAENSLKIANRLPFR